MPANRTRKAECGNASSILFQPQVRLGKGTSPQLKPCTAWLIYMQASSRKSSVWETAAKKSKVERGALLFIAKASLPFHPLAPKAPPRIKAGNSKPFFPTQSLLCEIISHLELGSKHLSAVHCLQWVMRPFTKPRPGPLQLLITGSRGPSGPWGQRSTCSSVATDLVETGFRSGI